MKVVLSLEQKKLLSELARRLGTSESEMMRTALMDYAKDVCLIRERVEEGRIEDNKNCKGIRN